MVRSGCYGTVEAPDALLVVNDGPRLWVRLVVAIALCSMGLVSVLLRVAGQPPSQLFTADPDGEVCAAFDQSADYSKCGRLEPSFFYWWALERYGSVVEDACGRSASFAEANPAPVSAGPTLNTYAEGNAWFVVCNFQALARLDDLCAGTFVAEPPSQDAPAQQYFGHDGLKPSAEDIAKGWTDPCAAHAFCTACDEGRNPFCRAYMQQRTLCAGSGSGNYQVDTLFNATARRFWCSKIPEIQSGAFEPSKLSDAECAALFWTAPSA